MICFRHCLSKSFDRLDRLEASNKNHPNAIPCYSCFINRRILCKTKFRANRGKEDEKERRKCFRRRRKRKKKRRKRVVRVFPAAGHVSSHPPRLVSFSSFFLFFFPSSSFFFYPSCREAMITSGLRWGCSLLSVAAQGTR